MTRRPKVALTRSNHGAPLPLPIEPGRIPDCPACGGSTAVMWSWPAYHCFDCGEFLRNSWEWSPLR